MHYNRDIHEKPTANSKIFTLILIFYSTLDRLKRVFGPYTKSTFRFPKFHLTTHYTEVISEYGSTQCVSTAHGEKNHKVEVKPAHRRTSQKKRTAQSELATQIEMAQTCRKLVRTFRIQLPKADGSLPMDDSSDEESVGVEVNHSHTFAGKVFKLEAYAMDSFPVHFRFKGNHSEAFAG